MNYDKKKIVIFTNNIRSINLIKELKKKFIINLIILSKKNLSVDLKKKIKKFKINTIFYENKNIDIKRSIQKYKIDFLITAGFPKKISNEIIKLPRFCSINLHGGKMPNYLGASTINWQIINNENKIYISALKMNSKIDGGPLIIQKYIRINKNENIKKIKERLHKIFPKVCIEAIKHILKNNELKYFSINKKTYWKQRGKKDSEILLNQIGIQRAHNVIRASSANEYPAYCFLNNKKILLLSSNIIKNDSLKKNEKYFFRKKKLFLRFKNGLLKVNKFKIL